MIIESLQASPFLSLFRYFRSRRRKAVIASVKLKYFKSYTHFQVRVLSSLASEYTN